ncbi:MAG TPA: uroporphyrinogen-III synthase [Gammaproteobacteria bacterium]|nr:uroporphyrinogen-III synthase [Gammaproteobacteria bacterium]
MPTIQPPQDSLAGRLIAVPEARHLDVLAALLESRGANVLRCPLISIRDAHPGEPVVEWIRRFIAAPHDLLILYTGEGVARLAGFAARAGLLAPFIDALANTRKLTRGPKPKRELRVLGLNADVEAREPTTEGILASLRGMELGGRRVGVQLYGTEPKRELLEALAAQGAVYDAVAPYTYASAADDAQVLELIACLDRGEIDAIAFTSKAQLQRLLKLARDSGREEALRRGLAATRVAAIGPVVAAELRAAGVRVDATPVEKFHMKPLVKALEALLVG